jgi:hypothetical protein
MCSSAQTHSRPTAHGAGTGEGWRSRRRDWSTRVRARHAMGIVHTFATCERIVELVKGDRRRSPRRAPDCFGLHLRRARSSVAPGSASSLPSRMIIVDPHSRSVQSPYLPKKARWSCRTWWDERRGSSSTSRTSSASSLCSGGSGGGSGSHFRRARTFARSLVLECGSSSASWCNSRTCSRSDWNCALSMGTTEKHGVPGPLQKKPPLCPAQSANDRVSHSRRRDRKKSPRHTSM